MKVFENEITIEEVFKPLDRQVEVKQLSPEDIAFFRRRGQVVEEYNPQAGDTWIFPTLGIFFTIEETLDELLEKNTRQEAFSDYQVPCPDCGIVPVEVYQSGFDPDSNIAINARYYRCQCGVLPYVKADRLRWVCHNPYAVGDCTIAESREEAIRLMREKINQKEVFNE